MVNSKQILFWGFETFLPVGYSVLKIKIDRLDANSEMTVSVFGDFKLLTLIEGGVRTIPAFYGCTNNRDWQERGPSVLPRAK